MGKGANTTTSNNTTTTAPDSQAAQFYRDLLTRAQGVGNTPYQSYTGELVAGTNGQQQLGIGGINNAAGFAQPYIQQAAQYANQAAQPITADQIQQYMSPYTQQVVNATQAQFSNQNQQQQSQLSGNAIAQGALGGNRVGVAQAQLAGQQQLAQAPVLAGLQNQGYQTGLQTALSQQQAQAQAAYSLGNLGVSGQNAALQGAGAQFGVGSQMQQTQQAQDTAKYGQFQQQQSYPFQIMQWLAGLGTGVGSQLGGTSTSSGQTTGPSPNQLAQLLGLGLSGASMLSDRRAKENISQVGKTNDGQPIYRYRYKGDPTWQIGLIAQDVERDHPEAVHSGVGNYKMVDIKSATDDSVRERSAGGFVPGFDLGGGVGGSPYGGVGWIPSFGITGGHGAPPPQAGPKMAPQQSTGDISKMTDQAIGIGKKVKGLFNNDGLGDDGLGNTNDPSWDGGIPLDGSLPIGMGGIGSAASGGFVMPRHFDDGGLVGGVGPSDFTDRFDAIYDAAPSNPAPVALASADRPIILPKSGGFGPGEAGPRDLPPVVRNDEVSPLDSAQWPSGPEGKPDAGVAAGPNEASPLDDAQWPAGPNGKPTTPGLAPESTESSARASEPRGIRNNNPGNIEDGPFAKSQPGYAGSDGRFAVFKTPEAGTNAASNLLGSYGSKGINTINGVINRWAPAADNNNTAAYISAVSKATGYAPNQKLDMADPEVRTKLATAIGQFENGTGGPSRETMVARNYNRAATAPAAEDATDLSARDKTAATPEEKKIAGIGGFNPLNLSDNTRMAMLHAGLGMLASRSPFLGNAIGEGGLQGLNAYTAGKSAEQKSTLENKKVDLEVKKLGQSADQFAQTLAQKTAAAKDTAEYHQGLLDRQNQILVGTNEDGYPVYKDKRSGEETTGATKLQGKVPVGYVKNPDGTMSAIKGGPADPEHIANLAAAKQGAALPDNTADFLAERVIAGDAKALVGLGRGAQGAQNISKVQSLVAQKAAERGLNANDLLAKVAEQSGLTAQQRTFGTQTARMAINATEAQGAIELGRTASANVPRGSWVPVTKAIQAFQRGTSDPALGKFGAANLAIINTYARAISPTGVPTVHDKEHAEQLLSTATSAEQYNAVLDQMNAEINVAHNAPAKAKKELEDIRKGRDYQGGTGGSTAAPATSSAPAPAPVEPTQREVNRVYMTPKGPLKWMGNGWAAP